MIHAFILFTCFVSSPANRECGTIGYSGIRKTAIETASVLCAKVCHTTCSVEYCDKEKAQLVVAATEKVGVRQVILTLRNPTSSNVDAKISCKRERVNSVTIPSLAQIAVTVPENWKGHCSIFTKAH